MWVFLISLAFFPGEVKSFLAFPKVESSESVSGFQAKEKSRVYNKPSSSLQLIGGRTPVGRKDPCCLDGLSPFSSRKRNASEKLGSVTRRSTNWVKPTPLPLPQHVCLQIAFWRGGTVAQQLSLRFENHISQLHLLPWYTL